MKKIFNVCWVSKLNKWNKYFMNIAKSTAELSRDPRTKVGAAVSQR